MPVALFSNRAKAEPLKTRLVEAGIPAEVHDELHLEKLWYAKKDFAGARLEVPAELFERAYELLLDWDAKEGSLRDAIRCPECMSLRVDYPQFTRKSFLPNLIMGLFAKLGSVEKEFYCEDCHFTWPAHGNRVRPGRANMAPYYFIEGVEQTTLNRPAGQREGQKQAQAA